MIKWAKRKLGIIALETEIHRLEMEMQYYRVFVHDKVAELKEYTRVDADVGFRGNNTIVLTGVYKRRAFVQFYDIGDGEFQKLVKQMKSMKDHALIRHVDAPPTFKASFDI